tara:strand:+ start:1700 stop:3181 length:1482 start_codon:yes stop_codon:yes gene_type:complete
MSFLEGLITGAATSIDDQLKKDMQRSQERAEGMAQYRITRRRAEIERQEKEKRELEDTLNNLASLVDGDIDKAAQLYINGGKNITGANALYQELLKNKQAGIDVNTAITFAETTAPEGTTMQDYISKFVTPITKLPVAKGEVKGAGLYGALFKPDLSGRVRQQVEEAAPLPAQEAADLDVQMATIDRSGFLSAKEAKRDETRFEREGEKFEMDMRSAQARLDDADRQYNLALERFNADKENNELRLALDFARDARDARRLDLAVAKAEQEAEDAVLSRELTGLTIEERKLELEKKRNAPEFATFELMLVSAEENLARATSPEEIMIYEKQRAHAIKGLADIARAEDTSAGVATSVFSKQSVDSIINAEIKRQLEPVGLVKDIEGQLDYMIEGNEVQFYDRMTRALENVEQRVAGIDDSQMTNTLKSQRKSLQEDKGAYIQKQIDGGITPVSAGTARDAVSKAFTSTLGPGAIVEYTNSQGATVRRIWTGSRYV